MQQMMEQMNGAANVDNGQPENKYTNGAENEQVSWSSNYKLCNWHSAGWNKLWSCGHGRALVGGGRSQSFRPASIVHSSFHHRLCLLIFASTSFQPQCLPFLSQHHVFLFFIYKIPTEFNLLWINQ